MRVGLKLPAHVKVFAQPGQLRFETHIPRLVILQPAVLKVSAARFSIISLGKVVRAHQPILSANPPKASLTTPAGHFYVTNKALTTPFSNCLNDSHL